MTFLSPRPFLLHILYCTYYKHRANDVPPLMILSTPTVPVDYCRLFGRMRKLILIDQLQLSVMIVSQFS